MKFARLQVDYTGVDMSSPCFNCSQNFSWNSTRSCTCTIPFYLEQPYEVRKTLSRTSHKYSHSQLEHFVFYTFILIHRVTSTCITASQTSTKITAATWNPETTASWMETWNPSRFDFLRPDVSSNTWPRSQSASETASSRCGAWINPEVVY